MMNLSSIKLLMRDKRTTFLHSQQGHIKVPVISKGTVESRQLVDELGKPVYRKDTRI